MTVSTAPSPEVALDAGATLGEGPVWDVEREQLLWVDCAGHTVHRFDPRTGEDTAANVGHRVGSVALRWHGGLMLAAGIGFCSLNERTGAVEGVAGVGPEPAGYVMNDGACDASGRFWAGTASHDGQPTAGLYRLDVDGAVTRVLSGVRMSNGIGWSPDSRLMYYVDSRTQGLDVFDFHIDDGMVTRRRRLVDVPAGIGIPDGLAVDAEGCLWLALWGCGLVHRYTSAGKLDRVVSVPTSHTTSCAFGGPGFAVLYITTALVGLTDQERRQQPHAGAIFAVTPGAAGLPSHGYAG